MAECPSCIPQRPYVPEMVIATERALNPESFSGKGLDEHHCHARYRRSHMNRIACHPTCSGSEQCPITPLESLSIAVRTHADPPAISFVDPTLEHDLASRTKPWALSPLVATMPYFRHQRSTPSAPAPQFPPTEPLSDDASQLRTTSASPTSPGGGKLKGSPSKRRGYFANALRRQEVVFGPEVRIPPLTQLVTTNRHPESRRTL